MINSLNAINRSNTLVGTSLDNGLSIKGQVKGMGVPIPCRVRLFEKLSGRLIADKLTDENGFYEFNHLTKTKFFTVTHHPASQFNAIIQDNVVPK
ncbi:hypothetical protein [Acinetobacter kyonggiensis]|uniref:hypothetical protein n=1 Tax=Acinetobacter kyonggiensis TaxID=595670 RepID=UPI000B86CBAB|nr:hypothetical protein [Acinetobacter kyonggiensis]